MKTRYTFVSNSSSSSFVVKASNKNNPSVVSIDLVDLTGGIIIKNIKQLNKYYEDQYGSKEEENWDEYDEYICCAKELESGGGPLIIGSLEYGLEGILRHLTKDSKVIFNEN